MTRLLPVLAALGLSARAAAGGCRVLPPPVVNDLLGFDESLGRGTFSATTETVELPETRLLSVEEIDTAEEEIAHPHVPDEADVEELLSKRFIVGADDRHLWNPDMYPAWSVGRIVWSNGVFCSGALVGPRHVLTARHCLISGATGTFSPGYDNGDRHGSGRVTHAISVGGTTPGTSCETKQDWAIFVLDTRLGDQLGYFGVKYPDASKFGQPILRNMGYPGDKDGGQRPYRQTGITADGGRSLECDNSGPVISDADTAGGQSGGPLWEPTEDGPYIWGDLSISVTSSEITFAGFASGSEMINAVIAARRDYP